MDINGRFVVDWTVMRSGKIPYRCKLCLRRCDTKIYFENGLPYVAYN